MAPHKGEAHSPSPMGDGCGELSDSATHQAAWGPGRGEGARLLHQAAASPSLAVQGVIEHL